MSGLEVAGVVLGAFPLVISAMEHYEEMKKVSSTWWKIRRAHRRDLGKVKDCQLKFRLNLKELLLPLLADDLVTVPEYEQLLANPGGPGWQEDTVEVALVERLSDCHERYIEVLNEMEETLASLCKATRVDDEQFQGLLKEKRAAAITPAQNAKATLMFRAHTAFQAKRVAYAFTIPKRETLLEEMESYNNTLEDVLAANDRISNLAQRTASRPSRPRIPKAVLQFWRHADCIFKLLTNAWSCHCKGVHDAKLWLKHKTTTSVDLKVGLQFCHGTRQCLHIKLADAPATHFAGYDPSIPMRLPLRPSNRRMHTPAIVSQEAQATSCITSSGGFSSRTVTHTAATLPYTPYTHHQSVPLPLNDCNAGDLCETVKNMTQRHGVDPCYGALFDQDSDRNYTVIGIPDSGTRGVAEDMTLSDALGAGSSIILNRVQRYSLATTLASSLLQFESTPWAPSWSSNSVRFPKDSSTPTQEQPYVLTRLDILTASSENSFQALGTLLLELCFGKPLDDHVLWQQPTFSAAKANPMLRQFVASEWLKEVDGEAGEQYASAVTYCLSCNPSMLKDEKWRPEFVQSVAWPLQQCYESMQPRQSSMRGATSYY